jgi:hypothetical protein
MNSKSLFDEGFQSAVIATFERAGQETLDAGVLMFYRDSASGIDIMERSDGRRFEIRYVRNAPCERHYEITRELSRTVA